MLDDIFAGLQGEVDVAGHALRIQVSGGAVLSRVKDTDVDAMIVKADLALYKAKELGKNDWRLFEAAMDAAFRNRQLMKADLRSAIEAKGAARRLPADRGDGHHAHRQLRGAVPLGPSRPRPDLAGASSFRSPRRWASSPRSAPSCWRRPAANAPDGPSQISVSVNLSAKDFRNRDIVDKVRDGAGRLRAWRRTGWRSR